MRIGTLACWLFGHKFAEEIWTDGSPHLPKGVVFDNEKLWTTKPTDYCVRCGKDKL